MLTTESFFTTLLDQMKIKLPLVNTDFTFTSLFSSCQEFHPKNFFFSLVKYLQAKYYSGFLCVAHVRLE